MITVRDTHLVCVQEDAAGGAAKVGLGIVTQRIGINGCLAKQGVASMSRQISRGNTAYPPLVPSRVEISPQELRSEIVQLLLQTGVDSSPEETYTSLLPGLHLSCQYAF